MSPTLKTSSQQLHGDSGPNGGRRQPRFRWTQAAIRQVAIEERSELGLRDDDPLDPYELAEAHGIPVYPLTALLKHGLGDETHAHFHVARPQAWSAALLPLGNARVIVENDAHVLERRRTNIAHELGHHLLEHEFIAIGLGEDHTQRYDKQQEQHATFLARELLVPESAARRMARLGWDNARVAAAFGVSEQLAQWAMAGPRVIVQRAAAKARRR